MSSNPKSDSNPKTILINPNFNQQQAKVHINPNFQKKVTIKPAEPDKVTLNQAHINPKFQLQASADPDSGMKKAHINPNFVARPLPEVPSQQQNQDKKQYYVNPSFLDPTKAKAYDESIKKAAETKKIFFNPKKFQGTPSQTPKATTHHKVSPGSSSEKENKLKRTMMTPSQCKKSLFKKIGTRKLIRVKGNKHSTSPTGSVNVVKINSPILAKSEGSKVRFKKIGTKKLVQVKDVSLVATPPNRFSSPRRYKTKTKRKLVVRTPRSLFSTPFSLKKKTVRTFNSPLKIDKRHKQFGQRFSSIFSPFRVDRRCKTPVAVVVKPVPVAKPVPSVSEQKSAELKMKRPVPPKPTRKKLSTTLINVQGVRYSVTDNGRKLNRLEPPKVETPKPVVAVKTPTLPGTENESTSPVQRPTTTSINDIIPRKLYLDGEEYIEEEPGVLIRSRNSMTRQSITSYKNRSINTIIKSQTRSKQYCMFYNKFGKCNKKEKGMCPYIHDPSKVAVCRKFLQANCHNDNCLLSHQVAPEKMPSCKFYLQGLCTKDPCPYRHVNVNPDAEVCPDFLKGFCPAGQECKKKHFLEEVTMRDRKIPPAKPKRKSICQTPGTSQTQEKKARVRYYDEKQADEKIEISEETSSQDFEMKRKRLLRKVELAKQGWTGVALLDLPTEKMSQSQTSDLDDSGPYEEIEEDITEKIERAPIGRLPSYISLEPIQGPEEHTLSDNEKMSQSLQASDLEECSGLVNNKVERVRLPEYISLEPSKDLKETAGENNKSLDQIDGRLI